MADSKQRTAVLMTFTVAFLLLAHLLPVTPASAEPAGTGFDKGISWASTTFTKKATFVGFDEQSTLDDYAYLSAVPSSVFYSSGADRMYTHPLLFHQADTSVGGETDRALNGKQGVDYFMDDWMSACNGRLDDLMLINVGEGEIDLAARNVTTINGDTPADIAGRLAERDWMYADEAVLAVINDDTISEGNMTSGSLTGSFAAGAEVKTTSFQVPQSNSLNPVYHEFTVPEQYKYLKADLWWNCFILGGFIAIPPGDPDLQLFCQHGSDWMQTAAVATWNILTGPAEQAASYVYNPGSWRVGVTDIPTERDKEIPRIDLFGGLLSLQGSAFQALRSIRRGVTYNIDVEMYPGTEVDVPDVPETGVDNASFTLEWNGEAQLGMSLIGPAGEEIVAARNMTSSTQHIEVDKLGGCRPGEHYRLCVFSMEKDAQGTVDFTVSYTWRNKTSMQQDMSLASAAQGAVLASALNAPLLYTSSDDLPSATKSALRTLGVDRVHVMDLGERLTDKARTDIRNAADIKAWHTAARDAYDTIRDITGQNDVIFSTTDPWTFWRSGELQPGGEFPGALFVGPAAFHAAQHGSPLLLLEMHPRLSSAVVWHNEFWRRHVSERFLFTPTVAEMYLTGKRVYDFLHDYGFDGDGMESMVTIAGQYDIGTPWDRVFVGKAKPGRIFGSPVDAASWSARNVFYPRLIFENPGLNPGGVEMINGSTSTRRFTGLARRPLANTLVVEKPSEMEQMTYPVVCSFVTHKYRFNERAGEYYGSTYQCADGLTPGQDFTFNPIDQGLGEKYLGIEGAIFPDMTETEVVPTYLRRGGYDVAFSTSLEAVGADLNTGAIMWVHGSHGLETECGSTLFWDPDEGFSSHDPISQLVKPFAGATREENPWRGYEWYLGSTAQPDTMTMDVQGTIPFTNIPFPIATGMDWALAREPVRETLNKIIPFFAPFNVDDSYDGVIGTIQFSRYPYAEKNATQIEAVLDNLHSMGFITSICQTANTYFHLSLVRHGSVFQVQDPWPTSWYGTIWRQSIPRDLVLGDTVGEAYVKGMSHVGILYITEPPQWWWDIMENVVLFGDPDLRVWVPGQQYSSKNHWEQTDVEPLEYRQQMAVDGHALYGATEHPHRVEGFNWMPILLGLAIVALIGAAGYLYWRRNQ